MDKPLNPFIASLFVQPRTVLNRRLLPFSAWHWAAFVALGLPFHTSRHPVTPDDLVVGVSVCQTRFGDDLTAVCDSDVQAWGHEFDFLSELETFRLYLGEHCNFVDHYHEDGKAGKVSAIPAPFYVVATVLQHVNGITEAEAWNMPLCRLVAYKDAVAEANGAELVSDRDMAAFMEATDNG